MSESIAPKPMKAGLSPVSLGLLAGLLVLRIPYLAGLSVILGNSSPDWLETVFDVGTFLLTALLIWVERNRLEEFHISPLAFWMILLFKPLKPVFEALMGVTGAVLSFPRPLSFIYLFISAGLLIALRYSHWRGGQISKYEWKWLGFGTLAGVGLVLVLSVPMAFSIQTLEIESRISLWDWMIAFIRIPQQLGYAAITEEPLFRGFLWGALRKYGCKNGWILIIQTLLFMLGHAYYFQSVPISFWIVVPLGGLAFGLLVWRSRTLVSSLACHSIVNAFGFLSGRIAGRLIFG